MHSNQTELAFENNRLTQTIQLATLQLNQARQSNADNKAAIHSAQQELRENTSHAMGNLWSSDGFEALADLSQYMNPITDKIAAYEVMENKIVMLESLIRSPYFARIDFQYEDDETPEKIYIGRTSLMDDDVCEMVVHDWRSPIASVFYRFVTGVSYYDAPGGRITGTLCLKRQYEIQNSVLEYFFDADVQIVDEFLRKLLSQNTSPKMKTIVETIQQEQDIVIRDMESELMMVQGVAGSGKTSVALHRAAYLMYQGLSAKLSAGDIIIISPNSLFEQYIANVLPELGESNVSTVVPEDILSVILKRENIQQKNDLLEALLSDSPHRKMIKSSLSFKTSPLFVVLLDRLITDYADNGLVFNDIFYGKQCIASKDELKNRFLSGRKGSALGVRLKLLADFVMENARLLHKEQRNHAQYDRIKNEMQRFSEPDVFVLYHKLFNKKNYLTRLAGGLNLPEDIHEIVTFTQENLTSKTLHHDDALALAYLQLKINGCNEYKNIKQVVIDEAQDYYPLHYELFHLLFTNAKYTVLGDINQTFEKQETLSFYEQVGKILNKKKATLVTLNKSFRCTNEILMFSAKLIEQSVEIQSFNRTGHAPAVSVAADFSTLCDQLVTEASVCLEQGFSSVGLICKTERHALDLFSHLKERLPVHLIKGENAEELTGLFIIPVYMAKGLEFDAVLVCDADQESYHSDEDKKLLYIACTRALHRLNLFCCGQASPLVSPSVSQV